MNTANTEKNARARWLFTASVETTAPLFLGSGNEHAATLDGQACWLPEPMLDSTGRPYLPGASLKGALRALAIRHGRINALKALFGDETQGESEAGLAEFCGAEWGANEAPQLSYQPHVAIDRATGTAEDQKLFHTPYLNDGARFNLRIVVHNSEASAISALAALLETAGSDPAFALGAHASQGFGRARFTDITIKRFGFKEASSWLEGLKSEPKPWHAFAVAHTLLKEKPYGTPPGHVLPLTLKFTTPFLVKKKGDKNRNEADAIPFKRGGSYALPGSSLRGRLRSQAERILRTLGKPVHSGHEAPPLRPGELHDDLAALLFGRAGWRGIVRIGDLIADKEKTVRQEMVAIDRFTGGGKDGAKFNVDYLECPTLKGEITLDLDRLKTARLVDDGPALAPALGLLTLVLRDLAEGDIPLGFGAAKGYGRCAALNIMQDWEKFIADAVGAKAAHLLAELRLGAASPAPSPDTFTVPEPVFPDFKPTPAPITPNTFHNPYHFIPLAKPKTETWTDENTLRESRGHDRYHGLSGSIHCTLTTRTPLFIGNVRSEHRGDGPQDVSGFTLEGKTAIPATSLRGMISSLFESISGSRLRVLHPEKYSMRKAKALSAMGRILISADKKSYLIQPLTWPTLEGQGEYRLPKKWQCLGNFAKGTARLRVYFDAPIDSYRADRVYFMKIRPISSPTSTLWPTDPLRRPGRSNNLVIGQANPGNVNPIDEEAFGAIPPDEQPDYIRGWVRTLSVNGRSLPATVMHHVFLPDPRDNPADRIDATEAVRRFHALADLALAGMHIAESIPVSDAQLLPYVPAGRRAGSDRRSPANNTPARYETRMRGGDLVFFDINARGEITEVSFSSIWRTGIERTEGKLATTADLLANFDANLLPLGMEGTAKFSPADLLFGTVEYRPQGNQDNTQGQALGLAGRVNFSFGEATEPVLDRLPAITLKELSSPKPPSPALYIRPILRNKYVSKTDLATDFSGHTLRGRKAYLHAWRKDGEVVKLKDDGTSDDKHGRPPWVSKYDHLNHSGNKRRVRVEPIDKKQPFSFTVDFSNLCQAELEQLCAALIPDPTFEHRLGMGKPLGLGSVKIKISKIELVNRVKRYGEDNLESPRVHQTLDATCAEKLAAAGMKRADPAVHRALQLIGNPASVNAPVHYPLALWGKLEEKHFQWFMANDNTAQNAVPGNMQPLQEIGEHSETLEPLKRL